MNQDDLGLHYWNAIFIDWAPAEEVDDKILGWTVAAQMRHASMKANGNSAWRATLCRGTTPIQPDGEVGVYWWME